MEVSLPMVGKVLAGRYEVLDRIGQGGMALVYRARDMALNRMVAVKLLRRQFTDDPGVVEHFQLEARAAASLDGPHVVQVYDVGTEDDAHYIVMELVNGQNLKDYVATHGPLPEAEALAIAVQIAEALHQAHARQIVHRDIKPQNILVTPEGQVKVTDFGIARAMASGTLVNTGSLVGTAQYLSPEQARGKSVGPATDLYGLGVVLYEMLTGKPPFDGDSPIAVALRHVQDPVPDVREARPDISPAVAHLVTRLLAKDPDDRYQRAETFRQQALAVLRGEDVASPATRPAPASEEPVRGRVGKTPPRRRRRVWPWVIAVVLLAALGTAGVTLANRWLASAAPRRVPEVVGLKLADAEHRLKVGGFRTALAGHAPSSVIPAGRVLDESPGSGRYPVGTKVTLTLSSGPMRVQVPTLLGYTQAEALADLSIMQLKGRAHQVQSSAPKGQVVNQHPHPGTLLKVGEMVTVDVSSGQSANQTKLAVPNLSGLTVTAAAAALSQVHMSLGGETYVYSTLTANTVMDQAPSPFSAVVKNGPVNVTVSKGLSPASAGQPVNQDKLNYTVASNVPANSLLKVVVTDSAGNEEVYYMQVTPGEPLTQVVTWYGSAAQVTTYLNGQQQGAARVLQPNVGTGAGGTPIGGGPGPGGTDSNTQNGTAGATTANGGFPNGSSGNG
jgi:beta-lactam-binding protein with PASTA domain/tRNA A-37 threonylcarbamoyl transferase component Bud32